MTKIHSPAGWDLEELGWRAAFAAAFAPYAEKGYEAARVCIEHKRLYRLYTRCGEVLGEVSGKLLHAAVSREELPAVGDWVAVTLREAGRATIHAVLPRQSKFSRKVAGKDTEEQVVAANIDTVFLVSSLNQDLEPRRIERYLIRAWDSGANPVIVLTKADLCTAEEIEAKLRLVEPAAAGVPIHVVSCRQNTGLEPLRQYLQPGQTVALLGSSGVGKSTLINHWVGEELLEVQEIRAGDDRGRHTTTRRQLIVLPQGGLVVDTPGMRELQLWAGDGDSGIAGAFPDIEALAEKCRFRDCRHEAEPFCAVKQAIAEGRLDPARLQGYRKLQRELAYLEMRQTEKSSIIERRRWKKIAQDTKKRKNRPL